MFQRINAHTSRTLNAWQQFCSQVGMSNQITAIASTPVTEHQDQSKKVVTIYLNDPEKKDWGHKVEFEWITFTHSVGGFTHWCLWEVRSKTRLTKGDPIDYKVYRVYTWPPGDIYKFHLMPVMFLDQIGTESCIVLDQIV